MNRNHTNKVALGGLMAALAVVIMSIGTLIPAATFVCPMLCMALLSVVRGLVGTRLAWSWYGAVAILSTLLAPDKEAAAVFVFIGYYPIIKPWLDQRRGAFFWKLVLFNASILSMYGILIYVLGLDQVAEDFKDVSHAIAVISLILGNLTLFLLDILLGRIAVLLKRKR